MANTKHNNLPQMPTGAVEWPALYNDLVAKVEVGRTIKLIAGVALVKGNGFYIGSDGKAYKGSDTQDPLHGVWQSASTAINTQGYGQIGGVIEDNSWTWTPGVPLYCSSAGLLTATVSTSGVKLGYALSAIEAVIIIKL